MPGIAPLAQARRLAPRAHQRAGAFERNGAAIVAHQRGQRRQAIGLHFRGIHAEQPAGLARMRRQYPIVALALAGLGDDVERIGIHDQRLAHNPA